MLEVLRRLGYLDDELNDDFSRAVRRFVSMPENSYWLRKNCKAMPKRTDTKEQVMAKLRRAFLSDDTSGQWRVWRVNPGFRHVARASPGGLSSKAECRPECRPEYPEYSDGNNDGTLRRYIERWSYGCEYLIH